MDKGCWDLIPSIRHFVERKCTPTWVIKRAPIDFDDLTYIVDGNATYIVNDIPYHLSKGDMLYIPAGSIRQAYTDPDHLMHCYAFNYSLRTFGGSSHPVLPLPTRFHIGIHSPMLNQYKEFNALWMEKREGFMLKARALFMLILYEVLRNASTQEHSLPNKRMEKVKTYIINNYATKIGLEDLANQVGLNPVYFGTYFRKHMGLSAKEYINQIRIHKAYDLLSTGGYTVSEVALKCGFDDIFYFSKTFKKITGIVPSSLLR